MKKTIIAFVIGIIVGGTGGYAILQSYYKKLVTKENVEKVKQVAADGLETAAETLKK